MRMKRLFFIGLVTISLLSGTLVVKIRDSHRRALSLASISSPPPQEKATAILATLPLSFEPNHGQMDPQVRFLARGPGYTLFLTATEAVLTLINSSLEQSVASNSQSAKVRQAAVKMRLVNANPTPLITGLQELRGKANYLLGNDPLKWRTNISTYGQVKYNDVYPGIDLVYYGNPGQLEHDFILAPGADIYQIVLAFDGTSGLTLSREGDLILPTAKGVIQLQRPVVYQEINGTKRFIEGRYVQRNQQIGFQVAHYDQTKPLVIDPVLIYSTYLGGSAVDLAYAIAIDSFGNTYVTGATNSVNFPIQNPFQGTFGGGTYDAFITKFDPTGSVLIYSTYLGGSNVEQIVGGDIAVDVAGNAYVTGLTASMDFPLQNPFQGTLKGVSDAFVTKLDSTGSALIYSTYLGGSSLERGWGIAVDTSNNAYITGATASSDFPLMNPFQSTFGGGSFDAFITKFNSTGSALLYSSYLGGSNSESELGGDVAIDAFGQAVVTGETDSINFPLQNPFQGTYSGGGKDAFVTKFNFTGSAVIYSTYLGGSLNDFGQAIAIDSSGNAYVTGYSNSLNFPTQKPYQPNLGGALMLL